MNLITYEKIIDTYVKYELCTEGGGRDSWEVAADVINELLPPSERGSDAEYFFHIFDIWRSIQSYIDESYYITTLENRIVE